MTLNQVMLEKIGVSSPEIERLVEGALERGPRGQAGRLGGGGIILALAPRFAPAGSGAGDRPRRRSGPHPAWPSPGRRSAGRGEPVNGTGPGARVRLGSALFVPTSSPGDEALRAGGGGRVDFLHLDVFDGYAVPDQGFPARTVGALRV